MSESYAKLWSSVTRSSLWQRESNEVRILFITMLAIADAEGYVGSSVPGLAKEACLAVEEIRDALNVLESPDPDSRDPANEGRRIKKAHRGWIILNYRKHRDGEQRRTRRREQARERQKRLRARRNAEREAAKNAAANGQTASQLVTGHNAPSPARSQASRNVQNEPLSNKDLQAPVTQSSPETLRQAEAEALRKNAALPNPSSPKSPHQELIEHHGKRWREKYGTDYVFQGGKDGTAVKNILAACKGNISRARTVVDLYFADTEKWIVDRVHGLSFLPGQINKYLAKSNGNGSGHLAIEDGSQEDN